MNHTKHAPFERRYSPVGLITSILLEQFVLLTWLERNIKPLYYLFAVPFFVQDVLYNLIIGTWLFLEFPRFRGSVDEWEFLFTTRLKRMDREGTLGGCTLRFKLVLNEIDPGHV